MDTPPVLTRSGIAVDGAPDPDMTRLFYGKSYVYSLTAAPFVALFGTNGFTSGIRHCSRWDLSARISF